MSDIQGPGKTRVLTLHSQADPVAVMDGDGWARSTAANMLWRLFCQDIQQTGNKRAAFRMEAMCPVPTSPASLAVEIMPGFAVVNNGADLAGGYLALYAADSIVLAMPSADPGTAKYYAVYLQLGFDSTSPATLEFRDPVTGNLYQGTANQYAMDAATVAYELLGNSDPGVTRLDAYTLLDAGQIPLAIVRIQAAASTIVAADVQDVRELFEPKMVADAYALDARVIAQLGDIIPSMGFCHPPQSQTAGGATAIPNNTIFWDQDASLLKYKTPAGATLALNTTP